MRVVNLTPFLMIITTPWTPLGQMPSIGGKRNRTGAVNQSESESR